MHGDEHVGLQLLDLGDHLLEILGRRGSEMEAADDRMHFLDSGDLLCLPHGIDNADMTTGAGHHQALAPDIEAGRVLMHVLVWHHFSLQLGRGVVTVFAARAFLSAVVDEAIRQHALDAVALDLAGRKGMVCDNGWRLA